MQTENEKAPDGNRPDPLSHPTSEQWVAFLYGELNDSERRELAAHRDECAVCRRSLAAWRHTAGLLDEWRLRKRAKFAVAIPHQVLKWGIAAAAFIAIGLWLGRISQPPPDLDRLKEALVPAIRRELQAELAAGFERRLAAAPDEWRSNVKQEVIEALGPEVMRAVAWAGAENREWLARLLEQHQAEHGESQQRILQVLHELDRRQRLIRRDLETVALTADNRLLQTEFQLGQLAAFRNPHPSNPSPAESAPAADLNTNH